MTHVTLKLYDGSYINTDHVVRYFVAEDVTRDTYTFGLKISIAGPQMPFIVDWYGTREVAQEALDTLAYRVDNDTLVNV
jgi:hypothetical protein